MVKLYSKILQLVFTIASLLKRPNTKTFYKKKNSDLIDHIFFIIQGTWFFKILDEEGNYFPFYTLVTVNSSITVDFKLGNRSSIYILKSESKKKVSNF